MSEKKNIGVIGAGVVGLCCARYLQREGHHVTVIDRVPPGESCSFGNAGSFSVSSILPNASIGILKKVPSWLMDPEGPLALRYSYLPRMVPWLAAFIKSADPVWAAKCHGAGISLYLRLRRHAVPAAAFRRDRSSRQAGHDLCLRIGCRTGWRPGWF